MNFEYLAKIQKQESIDIDNIGNCALDAYNDMGFNWVLIIKTIEGITEIVEYGPSIPDLDYPPANVTYTYDRLDFNERKIKLRIQKFLNDGYRNIAQAFEIDQKEASNKMKNLVEVLCL